jgi:hypothetical protein
MEREREREPGCTAVVAAAAAAGLVYRVGGVFNCDVTTQKNVITIYFFFG